MTNPVVAKRVREMQARWFIGLALLIAGVELMAQAHADTMRGYQVMARAANRLAGEQRDDEVSDTPADADSAVYVDYTAPVSEQ